MNENATIVRPEPLNYCMNTKLEKWDASASRNMKIWHNN